MYPFHNLFQVSRQTYKESENRYANEYEWALAISETHRKGGTCGAPFSSNSEQVRATNPMKKCSWILKERDCWVYYCISRSKMRHRCDESFCRRDPERCFSMNKEWKFSVRRLYISVCEEFDFFFLSVLKV